MTFKNNIYIYITFLNSQYHKRHYCYIFVKEENIVEKKYECNHIIA